MVSDEVVDNIKGTKYENIASYFVYEQIVFRLLFEPCFLHDHCYSYSETKIQQSWLIQPDPTDLIQNKLIKHSKVSKLRLACQMNILVGWQSCPHSYPFQPITQLVLVLDKTFISQKLFVF